MNANSYAEGMNNHPNSNKSRKKKSFNPYGLELSWLDNVINFDSRFYDEPILKDDRFNKIYEVSNAA